MVLLRRSQFTRSRNEIMNRELPPGWFPQDDIDAYRKLYEAVPLGGTTAELGCWLGRSICAVADIILARRIKVYVVDTFAGNPGFEKDFDIGGRDAHEEFLGNIARFGLTRENCIPLKMTTHEARDIAPINLDLIFIDADHTYEHVKQDIEDWKPKLSPGGILAGDDYGHPGVRKAVDELLKKVNEEASLWHTSV